jgi:predicted PurR-regulated permease PerM
VTAWTDSRLDDLAEAVRPVPSELTRLSTKVDGMAREMELIRTDLSAIQRQLAQIGWSIAGVLVVVLFTLVIALA